MAHSRENGSELPSGYLDDPTGLAFGPDQHLYVSSFENHRVLRYDGRTGDFLNTFVSFDQGLTFPTGLVFQTLEQPSHPLIVVTDGRGSGDVVSSPSGIDCGDTCSKAFRQGTEITLTAAPASNQVFVGWQGGGCAGTGSCIVTVTEPLNIIAIFEAQPSTARFLLAVVKQGSGTGNVTHVSGEINCGSACSAELLDGTSITLQATEAAGSVFVGWDGEGCSGIGDCTINMDQSRTLTATFERIPQPNTFVLSVLKAGTGSGRIISRLAPIDCGSICAAEVTEGATVTLLALPDPNNTFVGWQGGGCIGLASCPLTSTQNQIVTARFERVSAPRTLTVQKQGDGKGTIRSEPSGINCGSSCTSDFEDNTVVTLTLEQRPDSTFVGWLGSLCEGTKPCKVTMTENRIIPALVNPIEPPSDE